MDNRARTERLKSEARARALNRISVYRRLFRSPDGIVVLNDLKEAFYQKLNVPGDPFQTHVRVGNHEVLQYIKDIMEIDTDETT